MRPSLVVDNPPSFQLLKIEGDINTSYPLAQWITSGKQQMETARANVAYVSRLNAFEVGVWGRLPSDCTYSDETHRRKTGNKPQGVSMIKLRHLPTIGRHQA